MLTYGLTDLLLRTYWAPFNPVLQRLPGPRVPPASLNPPMSFVLWGSV